MRYKILSTTGAHPYEIAKLQVIPETPEDRKSLEELDEAFQDFLALQLNVVDILENSSPIFVVKRAKPKLGLG